jgi:hypothetical protein
MKHRTDDNEEFKDKNLQEQSDENNSLLRVFRPLAFWFMQG